jgi:hypothetical protein
MNLVNAVAALCALDGVYDPELSAHITVYQSRESELVLELEFVDADTGDYDRTERFTLNVQED